MRPTVSWTVIDCRIRVTDGIAVGSRGGWRWLVGFLFSFFVLLVRLSVGSVYRVFFSRLLVFFFLSLYTSCSFIVSCFELVSGDDVQNGPWYTFRCKRAGSGYPGLLPFRDTFRVPVSCVPRPRCTPHGERALPFTPLTLKRSRSLS